MAPLPSNQQLRAGTMMDEGPDLSHLTAEERAIIEGVMMRQKQEEEREQEIMRSATNKILPTPHNQPKQKQKNKKKPTNKHQLTYVNLTETRTITIYLPSVDNKNLKRTLIDQFSFDSLTFTNIHTTQTPQSYILYQYIIIYNILCILGCIYYIRQYI